jgi:hypothetical protein
MPRPTDHLSTMQPENVTDYKSPDERIQALERAVELLKQEISFLQSDVERLKCGNA